MPMAMRAQSGHGRAARQDFERKDYDSAEAKLRVILGADPGVKPAQDLAAAITAAGGRRRSRTP